MQIKQHIIHHQATVHDALQRLNALSGSNMTLFAVDDDERMLGTLTDGDVRRALVGGVGLEARVGEIIHRKYRCITGAEVDPRQLREFRTQGIHLIPWLNADGTIRTAVDLSENHTVLPLSAVLMAGGKGERLRPLTLTTPKPLLKLGGKSIIDYNIEALARCGITDIYVTIKYLAEKMREHFAHEVGGVEVKCVEEQMPLGTIGAAALCQLPDDGNTLVMNSDLLTNISFEEMYLHHVSEDADVTVAVIPYQVSVPFAILTTSDAEPLRVTGIEEKPTYRYFANAGIYIFPNKLLKALPTDTRTDATDLLQQAIDTGLKVTEFPINGTWIDIGSPADFNKAAELLKYVNG